MIQSVWLVFLDILLFLIIWLYFRKQHAFYNTKHQIRKENKWSIVFVLLFCIFPFYCSDYYHYWIDFVEIKSGGISNWEDVYYEIAKVCSSYWQFRVLVWGVAIFFIIKIIKLVDMPQQNALYIFISLYLVWFSYARVSLSMAIIYLGLAIAIQSQNKKQMLLGLIVCASAYFFHKSAPFGIVVALLSYFLINAGKKSMLLFFLIVAFSVSFLSQYLANFMGDSIALEDDAVQATAQIYLDSERSASGIGQRVGEILQRIPYYLLAYNYLYLIRNGKLKNASMSIKCFANASFICILLSSLFLFDLGFNTYAFYYRFLNFAMIPSTIFMVYCFSERINPRLTKCALISGTFASFYYMIYSAYNYF